jgi:hypothetical protein
MKVLVDTGWDHTPHPSPASQDLRQAPRVSAVPEEPDGNVPEHAPPNTQSIEARNATERYLRARLQSCSSKRPESRLEVVVVCVDPKGSS